MSARTSPPADVLRFFTRSSDDDATLNFTMRLFRSMLLAVDGSPASDAALAVACSLAKAYGGTVAGRHIFAIDPHAHGIFVQWVPDVQEEKRREARAIARAAEDKASGAFGMVLRVELVDGDPAEELLRAAIDIGADSIVIGNRGQSALSTLILGSVAQGVTERSRLPVLVVHDTPGVGRAATPSTQAANARRHSGIVVGP